jgi:hypothetical protein
MFSTYLAHNKKGSGMDDFLSHFGPWAASVVATVIAIAAWLKKSGAHDLALSGVQAEASRLDGEVTALSKRIETIDREGTHASAQIFKALDDHRAESIRKHCDISSDLQNYRLKMAEEYVSKSDLRESEGRIIQHINMVLSAVGCPYSGKMHRPSDHDKPNG